MLNMKAKEPDQCESCGRTIEVGEEYHCDEVSTCRECLARHVVAESAYWRVKAPDWCREIANCPDCKRGVRHTHGVRDDEQV